MNYIFIVLGSFLNRVRGGLFENLKFNKIFFPIFVGCLGLISEASIASFLSKFIAGYVGQQIAGWGAYVGSLTTGAKPSEECSLIDDLINECRITLLGKVFYLKDFPRTWGFCGLLLRGLLWSYIVGTAFNSIPVMVSGVLMPVCYLIPTLILWHTSHNQDKTAWNLGEWIWGAVLTSFIVFLGV